MTAQLNQDNLRDIVRVLEASWSSKENAVQDTVALRLKEFKKYPTQFSQYLLYIVANYEELQVAGTTAVVAAILLKTVASVHWDTLPPPLQLAIKRQATLLLGTPDKVMRNSIESLVASIARENFRHWPDLLPTLCKLATSDSQAAVIGSMGALSKLVEDAADKLCKDREIYIFLLQNIVPLCCRFFQAEPVKLRTHALSICNELITAEQSPVLPCLSAFLEALVPLTSDGDTDVRKTVCQTFIRLFEKIPRELEGHFKSVFEYIVTAARDDDEELAIEACEFWLSIAEHKEEDFNLEPYFPDLIPVLLEFMRYTKQEIDDFVAQQEREDRQQDIRPSAHEFRHTASSADADDDDDDDDDLIDDFQEWTIRKCSAAALDMLANEYKVRLWPHLFPHIKVALESPNWGVKEAAILALGAIAEGCRPAMEPILGELVMFLVQSCLTDPQPFVRSITCWTLSRYSIWIVNQETNAESEAQFFQPLLAGVLQCILDDNKRVQTAACSAFATLIEARKDRCDHYLEYVVRTLVGAFERYQRKNMANLYDAISTLAECTGERLEPEYVARLMEPLARKWDEIPNSSPDLVPLLECFSALAMSLGPRFIPYAKTVFHRCTQIIHDTLVQDEALSQAGQGDCDKDLMIIALDVLSGLADGLGEGIEGLAQESNILPLIFKCTQDKKSFEVRQAAFAVIGDFACNCYSYIAPHAGHFLQIAYENLIPASTVVCNNASWAIGEIALKCPQPMPCLPEIVERLATILETPLSDGVAAYHLSNPRSFDASRAVYENCATCIGRIGLVATEAVAPMLGRFMKRWCVAMFTLEDSAEKASTVRGMCRMIQANPHAAAQQFVFFCVAVASCQDIDEPLRNEITHVLHGVKAMCGEERWQAYYQSYIAQLSPQVTTRLREQYELF